VFLVSHVKCLQTLLSFVVCPALQYFFTLSQALFSENVNWYTYNMCLSISSSTYVWNISYSKKNICVLYVFLCCSMYFCVVLCIVCFVSFSVLFLCIQGVPGRMCQTSGECPYVKVYRSNPKHLCPKLNGYGDNGQRKVWSSGGSTHCTWQLTSLINVCPWVRCPMTESPLTLAYSRLIPECAVSHVTSVLAFMCHV